MRRLYDVAPLEGYAPEVGLLLAGLEDSTREWREELGEPPVEAMIWQARPGGHSIGGVLLHLIDVEAYWFETFAAKRRRSSEELRVLMSEEIHQYGGRWPTPPAEPIGWYLELHDRIRKRAFEALRGLEPERVYSRKSYDMTLRWVVAHVMEHDAYHGGQAVLLHDLWAGARAREA